VALALLLARVRPVRAALAALLVGVAAAVLVMPAPVGRLAEAEGRALLTGVEVAAIVLGGLLPAELLDAGGAQERIGTWLAGISQDRGRDVLLVVLGVTPFVESVTGFGVGRS
jgi:lactate permease